MVGGGREAQEGKGTRIHIADSLHCTAETNTILSSNYTPIKINVSASSLVAQTVKRLPTMRETRSQSLGREDPLEKEVATHSSTLAWKIPWTEKPEGL